MKTYNTSPYYDDFAESKSFYQLLFNPGYAVQARELTQMQTILRNQIEKFGNHVFKHGSVVIPGNSFADLAVPFVTVQSTFGGNTVSNTALTALEGQIIAGPEVSVTSSGGTVTTRLRARVKKVVLASGGNPTTLYLSYLSGTASSITFADGTTLSRENTNGSYTEVLTASSTNATGFGALAFVNAGVYYVNGTFAYVAAQSVVMSRDTSTPSVSVYLKINETIVNAEQDASLLDPAQGSNNYAAPGADRVKITLELVSLAEGSTISADYIELMRYKDGELLEHLRNPQYSELEKSLARRTFDESGNYVVTGFQPVVYEHNKAIGGIVPAPNGDSSKLVVEVTPGKAYIEGFEVEKIAKTRITINKARDSSHIKLTDVNLRPTYGQYLYIANPTGAAIPIATRDTITLYNASASGTNIGTAKILAIDYYTGDVSAGTSVYKLWITDVDTSQPLDVVGRVEYGSGGVAFVVNELTVPSAVGTFTQSQVVTHSSGRTGTVWYWNPSAAKLYVYKHNSSQLLPQVGDLIVQTSPSGSGTIASKVVVGFEGQSSLIFPLPKPIIKTLRNTSNAYDIDYVVQKQYNIVTTGGSGESGSGTVSTAADGIPQVDVGTYVVITPSGSIAKGQLTPVLGTTTTLNYQQAPGEVNGTYTVYVNIAKTLTPRTKTLLQSSSLSFSVDADADVNLGVVDVVRIRTVTLNSVDVTSSYSLDTRQTDYSYGNSVLRRKPGVLTPAGTLTVLCDRYVHGPGDYFCVDSYDAGTTDHLDRITSYTSPTTGQTYDLLSAIDFRPSGTSASDVVVSGTVFSTPIQYYVPRIDAVAIDARGDLTVINGIPSEAPKPPNVQSSQLALSLLYIPEYTRSAAGVTVTRLDVDRFTMKDIQRIVDRVERLEEFATLSAAETDIINYDVVDPVTGLSRFKTGYLVENFVQPLAIARTTSADFSASFVGRTLQPGQEKLQCPLTLATLPSNVVNKNGFLMKSYTEEVFIEQPVSSRITTVNPFATISWNGILSVNPPVDEWVEILERPTIFETREELVDVLIPIPVPLPAVTPPGFTSNPPPARPYISPDIVVNLDADLGLANGLTNSRTGSFNAINWWTPTSNGQASANAIASALNDQETKYPSRSLADISLSAQLDPIIQDKLSGFASSLSVVGSTSSVQSTSSLVSGGLQRIVAR